MLREKGHAAEDFDKVLPVDVYKRQEVHDARLGGLLGRILACKARLTGYLSGDISALEELEEERLGGYERTKGLMYNNWAELISANIV